MNSGHLRATEHWDHQGQLVRLRVESKVIEIDALAGGFVAKLVTIDDDSEDTYGETFSVEDRRPCAGVGKVKGERVGDEWTQTLSKS